MTEEEIARFTRFGPLHRYMGGKSSELRQWQKLHDPGPELVGDPRKLTNIGTFRTSSPTCGRTQNSPPTP